MPFQKSQMAHVWCTDRRDWFTAQRKRQDAGARSQNAALLAGARTEEPQRQTRHQLSDCVTSTGKHSVASRVCAKQNTTIAICVGLPRVHTSGLDRATCPAAAFRQLFLGRRLLKQHIHCIRRENTMLPECRKAPPTHRLSGHPPALCGATRGT